MGKFRVTFDYQGQHYDLRVSLKRAKSETGFELGKAKFNENWSLDNYNERDGFFATCDNEEWPYVFELEIAWSGTKVNHLRIWERGDDGVLLDDEGGTENFIINY